MSLFARPPVRKPDLVLVQARDEEGFWANVHEGSPVNLSVKIAEQWSHEHKADTRVVVGVKREVVKEFFG